MIGGASQVPFELAGLDLVRREPIEAPRLGRIALPPAVERNDGSARKSSGGQSQVFNREHAVAIAAERAIGQIIPNPLLQARGKLGRLVEHDLVGRGIRRRVRMIFRRDFPQPLAGGKVNRQQVPHRAHQDHVVDHQRMQRGGLGNAPVAIHLPEAQDIVLHQRIVGYGNVPAGIQQRRTGLGAGIAGGIAPVQRPVLAVDRLARPLRPNRLGNPSQRIGPLGEQPHRAAAERYRGQAAGFLERQQRGTGLVGQARLHPADGRRQREGGLEAVGLRTDLSQPLQGECRGQGTATIQGVQPQQQRGLVTGLGMEKSPGNFRQAPPIALGNRLFQHPFGPRPVLKLVRFAPGGGHFADQPIGLPLQTAVHLFAARRRNKVIFRRLDNATQVAGRFAETPLVQQFLGTVEPLQNAAIGPQEHVFAAHVAAVGLIGLIIAGLASHDAAPQNNAVSAPWHARWERKLLPVHGARGRPNRQNQGQPCRRLPGRGSNCFCPHPRAPSIGSGRKPRVKP